MAERELNGPSGSQTVRCFVGAAVEAGAAQRLQAAFLARFPTLPAGARLVPLSNYHVTLKFLGQVRKALLPDLVDQVAALGAGPLTVEVSGYAGLPRAARAHSVVAELVAHPDLVDWKCRLEVTVGKEDRPYRPHVTVARCRPGATFPAAPIGEPLLLPLHGPQLFRSDQVPGGVKYTPITALPGSRS
jgi:RNA 2',3'-cyclic 3'-phosphodiesterase